METATKALATEDGQSAQTTQLQAISTAIGNIGLNNIGNLATLTTTDKTSLVGAVNEVNAGLATKADETEVAAIENVYSSKNLLENKATTQTIYGVTYTVNADKSVTAVGTATANAQLVLNTTVGLKPGTYKLSGALSQNKRIFLYNGSTWINDLGNGVEFTITGNETQQQVAITVLSGETVNGTFYPMIRDARVKDATYVPYAMTNRELTEMFPSKVLGIENGGTGASSYNALRTNIKIPAMCNFIAKNTTTATADLSFNLSGRGSGIMMISRNGYDSSVYAITVSSNNVFSATKIAGADVSINGRDITNVLVSVSTWSNVVIIANAWGGQN